MDDNCGERVECMGVATGCGCKEVYRFPHTTYPYCSCICSFLQQHPYFLIILLNVYIYGQGRAEQMMIDRVCC